MRRTPSDGNTHVDNEVFVGRQPIFDRSLKIAGYALLHDVGAAPGAASALVLDALMELGLDRLVGAYPAFLQVTPEWIDSDRLLALPPDRVVLELPGLAAADNRLLAGVRALDDRGFRFALGDGAAPAAWEALLPHAGMIRLNVGDADPAELDKRVTALRPHGRTLLAEGVERPEVYERCRAMGFERFQGHFLSHPQKVKVRRMPPGKYALLKLLTELNDPNTDAAKVEALVAKDAALACRMLKHINAPFFGLSRTVESMRQAVVLLGLDAVRRWATLLLLVELSDKPQALMTTALVRARMCEGLARAGGGQQPDMFFTVGLLSVLDALTDMPMPEVVGQLPLAEPVSEALLEHKGPAGEALAVSVAYEAGQWERVSALSPAPGAVRTAYVEAVTWADAAGAAFGLTP